MKKIKINETAFNSLFKNTLLIENRESKNINIARKYLKDNNYSQEQAQQILDSIRTDIRNSRIAQCKFLKGVVRLYLDNQLTDGHKISNLNKILPYIGSDAHVNEYDNNLNNLSLDELVNRFSGLAKQDAEQARIRSNSKQHVRNTEYKIVRIPDFETASQYSNYTDWCVTYDDNMYSTYTNNGLGLFYFCLKNGFENVERIEGENAPLDEYGLSMIAVSVDEEGEPNTITSRWNHAMGGNDSVMTKDELEDLLGVNFYDVFKPYSKEEIEAKKEVLLRPFREANERLKNGEDPNKIFDYVYKDNYDILTVTLNGKWSIINTNGDLIGNGELWFNNIDDFRNGFAQVKRDDNKYSLIDKNGNLINDGKSWFKYISNIYDGFARVQRDDNKWSLIDTNGNLIYNGNLWLDYIDYFDDGFAGIELNGKYSYLDKNGKLIGDGNLWFKQIMSFNHGFGIVQRDDDKWSFINKKGRLIGIGDFNNNNFHININGIEYYMDTQYYFYNSNKELVPSPMIKYQTESKQRLNKIIKETINYYLNNNLIK